MLEARRRDKRVQITLYVAKPGRTKQSSSQARQAARRHPRLRNSGGGYDRKAQLLLYSRELRASGPKSQLQKNKVKEATQSHKTKPQKKVKEDAAPIASSPKPQRQAAESLQEVAASQQPEKKSVLNSSGAKPEPNVKEAQQRNRKSAWKVVPVGQNPAQAKLTQQPQSCFGDWKKVILQKLLFRAFCGRTNEEKIKKRRTLSGSLSNKMKAIAMSTRVEKQRNGFMAKFLPAMEKHR